MNSTLRDAYQKGAEEYKIASDNYEYGYQQGRADKYQEIVSEYMLLTEEQVNQIRADAIDEFFNEFDKWIKSDSKLSYFWTEFELEARRIAERLKEQK